MTGALEVGEWSAARPGRTLPPGKTRYPFYRRLGGPQGRSGRTENIVLTGIPSRTAQPLSVAIPTELPDPHIVYIYIYIYIILYCQKEYKYNLFYLCTLNTTGGPVPRLSQCSQTVYIWDLSVSSAKFCGVITVACNVFPLHKDCSWLPCYLFFWGWCVLLLQEGSQSCYICGVVAFMLCSVWIWIETCTLAPGDRGRTMVLQIGRSLVRSQLVSVGFSWT